MGREAEILEGRDGPIRLSVIVPCFNEQEVVELTFGRLVEVLGERDDINLELVFVDDGSKDETFSILESKLGGVTDLRLIKLSRNFGHQMAVTAGLENASGDVIAIIDADLQDPPEVILEMIDEWRKGFNIVYGIRAQRKESMPIKLAYKLYYRILQKIASIDIPLDSGDFCVMDRQAVQALNSLPEKNRYVRGLRAWLGFEQKGIVYMRPARSAGESKYSMFDLVRLAVDGVVNFSVFPLSLIAALGLATSVVSIFAGIFYIVMWVTDFALLGGVTKEAAGFTSIILAIFFFGGTQLFSLGIIGQYLGRMYIEIKRRPNYIVEQKLGFTGAASASADQTDG